MRPQDEGVPSEKIICKGVRNEAVSGKFVRKSVANSLLNQVASWGDIFFEGTSSPLASRHVLTPAGRFGHSWGLRSPQMTVINFSGTGCGHNRSDLSYVYPARIELNGTGQSGAERTRARSRCYAPHNVTLWFVALIEFAHIQLFSDCFIRINTFLVESSGPNCTDPIPIFLTSV